MKEERRKRRWDQGPPGDAAGAAAAQPSAEQQPPARRSAWDTAPEPPPGAAVAGTPAPAEKPVAIIEWGGVAIGETGGCVQHTLSDGRQYYHTAGEVSWERPTAQNHTKVGVDPAAAEPVTMEAVGPVGGVVTRRDTGASAGDALAAALARKRARERERTKQAAADVGVVRSASRVTSSRSGKKKLAEVSDDDGPAAGLGYGVTALGTGRSGARQVFTAAATASKRAAVASSSADVDAVTQMQTQLATVDAAIARAGGTGGAQLQSLRNNLVEAIGLAQSSSDPSSSNGLREIAPSVRVDGGGCAVLCAMPDGIGLWCRAVTLAGGDCGGASGGVRVRIITPVCEDYRDREHTLQPSALRPDFESQQFNEGVRVLAPYTDGLWYSARVVNTSARRARQDKVQVAFDEYASQGVYTVPFEEVIPRQAAHEPQQETPLDERRRREREAADAKQRPSGVGRANGGSDEGGEGMRTLGMAAEEATWEQVILHLK